MRRHLAEMLCIALPRLTLRLPHCLLTLLLLRSRFVHHRDASLGLSFLQNTGSLRHIIDRHLPIFKDLRVLVDLSDDVWAHLLLLDDLVQVGGAQAVRNVRLLLVLAEAGELLISLLPISRGSLLHFLRSILKLIVEVVVTELLLRYFV